MRARLMSFSRRTGRTRRVDPAAKRVSDGVTCSVHRGIDRGSSVVAAEHADHDALDLAAVGLDDAGFHRAVGGLEADAVAALLVEALERRLAAVEQGDD